MVRVRGYLVISVQKKSDQIYRIKHNMIMIYTESCFRTKGLVF